MKCNPWRWLWGIIPIAMLTWLAFTWEREGIETDLRSRSESALEGQGYAWGHVTLDGRDAFLTGVAPDESQPYKATEVVRNVRGVRIVRSRTDASPQVAVVPQDDEAERLRLAEAEVTKRREEEAARTAEAERQRVAAEEETKRREEEAARTAEAERQRVAAEEETKRREEEAARAAEAERQRVAAEEETKRREEEAARAAEAERQRVTAEEEAKRREEEVARTAEAERQRVAAEEETKRREEEAARAAEEQREQQAAEAEAQRLADEQAKAEEEAAAKRKAEEEAAAAKRAEEEAEAKRKQEQELAAAREKEAEETKRKAEADHCDGLMRSAMAEGTINFARAKADITSDSHLTLDRLAGIAKVCPQARINIAGHTDAEGEPERNQGLSERRAQAVADYLIGKGVDPSRLKTEGFGETRPLAPNDTPQGMRQNRRIEFTVTPAS